MLFQRLVCSLVRSGVVFDLTDKIIITLESLNLHSLYDVAHIVEELASPVQLRFELLPNLPHSAVDSRS